jgi:hypothetical protein
MGSELGRQDGGGKIAKQANAEGNASDRVMQGLLLCGTELNLAS